ncbi:hypothetical protein GCM10017607_18780 [Microbacterium thalassium]|nr:hypothetical protein GCM10017607_18780 [Microbacterium thalassium]
MLIVIVAIAAGIWLLIAQPWKSAASDAAAAPVPAAADQTATALPVPSSSTPSPSATPTVAATTAPATPSPESTPVAQPCIERDLTIEAVSDKASYAADENPQFSISLTNDGDVDCTLNVGTTTQVFTVTSGSDTWWRSTDCQTEPSDMVVTLAAGQTVQSASPLEWDRTRSAVGTCDSDSRPRAAGNGATYWLDVEIGGFPAIEAISFMLY